MKNKHMFRLLATLVLVLAVLIYMPRISLAGMTGKVTQSKPGMICTEPEKFEGGSGTGKKNGKKWLWTIAGVLIVAGIAAAAAGGGGGGGGSEPDATGSISGEW